jgi:hypothetical protein
MLGKPLYCFMGKRYFWISFTSTLDHVPHSSNVFRKKLEVFLMLTLKKSRKRNQPPLTLKQ